MTGQSRAISTQEMNMPACPGLPIEQEPKYTTDGSAIINRASGEAIPADEPVFVLRARDVHALKALHGYHDAIAGGDREHVVIVRSRILDFARFAREYPDRMKEPDTRPAAKP